MLALGKITSGGPGHLSFFDSSFLVDGGCGCRYNRAMPYTKHGMNGTNMSQELLKSATPFATPVYSMIARAAQMPTPTPYMEDITRQESSVDAASSEEYTALSPTIFVERAARRPRPARGVNATSCE